MTNKKEMMPFPKNLSEEEMQTMSKKYESSKEEIQELIERGIKAEDIEMFLETTQDKNDKDVFIRTYLLAEKDQALFVETVNEAKHDPEKLREMCDRAGQHERKGGLRGDSK